MFILISCMCHELTDTTALTSEMWLKLVYLGYINITCQWPSLTVKWTWAKLHFWIQ